MQLLEDLGQLAIDVIKYAIKSKSLMVTVEEQTKVLECAARRIYTWCIFLGLSFVLLMAGLGLVIWGFYLLLAPATGSGPAALIIGIIVSLLAAIMAVTVKYLVR